MFFSIASSSLSSLLRLSTHGATLGILSAQGLLSRALLPCHRGPVLMTTVSLAFRFFATKQPQHLSKSLANLSEWVVLRATTQRRAFSKKVSEQLSEQRERCLIAVWNLFIRFTDWASRARALAINDVLSKYPHEMFTVFKNYQHEVVPDTVCEAIIAQPQLAFSFPQGENVYSFVLNQLFLQRKLLSVGGDWFVQLSQAQPHIRVPIAPGIDSNKDPSYHFVQELKTRFKLLNKKQIEQIERPFDAIAPYRSFADLLQRCESAARNKRGFYIGSFERGFDPKTQIELYLEQWEKSISLFILKLGSYCHKLCQFLSLSELLIPLWAAMQATLYLYFELAPSRFLFWQRFAPSLFCDRFKKELVLRKPELLDQLLSLRVKPELYYEQMTGLVIEAMVMQGPGGLNKGSRSALMKKLVHDEKLFGRVLKSVQERLVMLEEGQKNFRKFLNDALRSEEDEDL